MAKDTLMFPCWIPETQALQKLLVLKHFDCFGAQFFSEEIGVNDAGRETLLKAPPGLALERHQTSDHARVKGFSSESLS